MPEKRTSALKERVPPQNIEAERALLGCMLMEEEARIRAFETVKGDFFYVNAHQVVFNALLALFDKNEKCDLITLTNQLRKEGRLDEVGGVESLAGLVESIPTAAHLDEYIAIVKDKYILRSLIASATRIVTEAHQDPEEVEALLDKAESLIFDVSQHRIEKEAYPLRALLHDTVEALENMSGKGMVTGLATGYVDLDKQTSGFQPSDLIIIASRPSMGKTALACNIAMNVSSLKDHPVLIFSLEMSKEQLAQRMLCVEARINLQALRGGFVTDRQRQEMLMAASRLEKLDIFIDDTPALNVFEVRARARRLKAKENIQLVIVDYLQLMRGRGRSENRQQEISEISASLKSLSKELAIPVVAVSQLSRATERSDDKMPELSHLRESGAIEQDADLVLLLYREEYYRPEEAEKGKTTVRIAKQRNGPTGDIFLTFFKEFTRFDNYTPRTE